MVCDCGSSGHKKILKSMRVMALRRKSALKTSQFFKSEKPALRKLGTENICQVLRVILEVNKHVLNHGGALFFRLFTNGTFRHSA